MDQEGEAQGWEAITAALGTLYGPGEPMHWGTILRGSMGGPDPLDGISAYDAGEFWHYISFGLTELYNKESDHADVSGFGFELSFRLRKTTDEAPVWPVNLFQNLARYVFQSGNVFSDGDYMPFNGPICANAETELVGGLFVDDPDLGTIQSPHGEFSFRQLIAVTDAEILAAQGWNTHGVAALLRERGSDVADLSRSCWTEDAEFAEQIAAGASKEGSRTGLTYVSTLHARLEGDVWEVEFGALAAKTIRAMLPGRIPFDMPYVVTSDVDTLAFHPGEANAIESRDGGLVLTLTAQSALALAQALEPTRGTYGIDGLDVVFQVVPTEIRNPDGEVTGVVG